MPILSEDHKQSLNKEIVISELKTALEQMKLGQSPGFDGLTLEFYRAF